MAIISNGTSIITGGALASGIGGKVGQTISVVKSNTFSFNSTSDTTIGGYSVSITPSSTSSKILVLCNMSWGQSSSTTILLALYRGSTAIAQGDADGVRLRYTSRVSPNNQHWCYPVYFNYLDSPSTTSSTTYTVKCRNNGGTNGFLNRTSSNGNDTSNDQGRPISTITAMEILA